MPSPDRSAPEDSETEMRYLTGVLRPIEKTHPVEQALAKSSELTPVAIHQTKLLDDNTCITLLQVRGDLDRLHDILSGHPSVLEYALAGEQDGFVYLQTEPHDLGRFLLRVQAESELIVQLPLKHTRDGGVRGTFIGTDDAFQWAVDALPDEFDLEIKSIGDYHPDMRQLFLTLTDRQQEILSTAIRDGYYDDPRRVTQQDIAKRVGIASGTVSQHLRRIEAKVFSEFIPEELSTNDE